MKIEATQASLQDLKVNSTQGLLGKIYSIEIEVPVGYLEYKHTGAIMAYHACNQKLYEFILGSRGAYVNSIVDGIANITIEVGESYLHISLRELQIIPKAYLVLPDKTPHQTDLDTVSEEEE